MVEVVAQQVGCLLTMYKVHYPEPSMPGVAHTCNPNIRGWKQENQEFKVFLGYIANLRLAWVMWDPAHYPHLKEYIQEVSFHRYGKLGLHCYLWRARCTNLCTCGMPSHFYYVKMCVQAAGEVPQQLEEPATQSEDQSVDPSTTSLLQLTSANNSTTKGMRVPSSGLWGHLHTHVHTLTKTCTHTNT